MVKAIPEHLRSLTPQLNVDGAAEAIAFYQKAFGATELSRAPDPTGKKIWHAEIRIGDSVVFVNDVFPEMGSKASQVCLWLYVDGLDAAFARATGAGAVAEMPPMDMFWGDRMASVRDPYGNQWQLAQRVKTLTHDEMERAGQEFARQQAASR